MMTEPIGSETVTKSETGRPLRYLRWLLGLLLLGVGIWVVREYSLLTPVYEWFRDDFKLWLDHHPVLGPGVFILVYIVTAVSLVPGSALTIVAGGVFGPIWGLIWVSIASTLAAGAGFLIARYIAADWVERRTSGKLSRLKRGIEEEGWRFVAFTRLVPIFPYNLLNYMFGLTRINFWVYFVVTWVCMLPGTFAYVYAGYAGRKVVFGEGGIGYYLTYIGTAVGILILATMLPRLVRRFRDRPVEDAVEPGDNA